VADHENRHGAEGNAQPAHEAEQVGPIELVGADESQETEITAKIAPMTSER